MKNKLSILAIIVAAVIVVTLSCSKESTVSSSPKDYSFTEEFDTISKAVARGWVISNNTKPIGTVSWIQGFYYFSLYHGVTDDGTGKLATKNYPSIGGFSGADASFSGTDFIMTTSECGHNIANCSNWLISPEVMMKNGDAISFYTRTYENPALGADRLEVRLNSTNSSADVGKDSGTIGNFSTVLLDINPGYLLSGDGSYPAEWTKYTATISGLTVPKKARIAFRYYVPNGGPQGPNSLGIGIDKFQFSSKYY